jgi:hypothetical protein
MLMYNVSSVKGENPMFARKFLISGTGTVLKVNLESAPVGMDFRGGHRPAHAFMRACSGPAPISITLSSSVMHVELDRSPEPGERADIEIEFFYEGEQ